MITIRQADQGDAERIREIFVSSIRELAKNHYSPRQIEAWSQAFTPVQVSERIRAGRVYVAECDGQVAGFAEIDAPVGGVEMVYTAPEYARQGIGTALMQHIESLARESGAKSLHLRASMNAVPFYERMGFTEVERTIHCDANGVEFDCAYMTKQLF